MDGWMDGWDGKDHFFFARFSKTTQYITLIVSRPPRRRFKTSLVKKLKKIKIFNFVKNVAQNGYIFQKKYKEFPCILTDFGGFDFSITDLQI